MRLRVLLAAAALHVSLMGAENAAPPPSLVETIAVENGKVNPLQRFVGTLYYDRKSLLAAESAGRIEEVLVSEGQSVRAGDALVRIDTAILASNIAAKEAAIRAQEADLENQQRDLERSKALLERNSISQSGYDSIYYSVEKLRALIDAAKSELQSLKIALDKSRIAAPYSGVISAKKVNVGEWVSEGSGVMELVDPQSIEARVSLPAELLASIASAQRVEAEIDGIPVEATIKTVIPLADKITRTFPVELSIKSDAALIEGMRIDVRVPMLSQSEALLVPRDAVIRRFGQMVIFAVNDGTAMMLPVQVIGYDGNRAAIEAAGLHAGMDVVVKGNERIFPGMPVRTNKAQP